MTPVCAAREVVRTNTHGDARRRSPRAPGLTFRCHPSLPVNPADVEHNHRRRAPNGPSPAQDAGTEPFPSMLGQWTSQRAVWPA
jgi:hypothetical protein